MPDLDEMTPGEILADSSVADFIKELGLGIAAAQAALDDNSVRQMELFTTRRDDLGGRSLLDLGLTPAFYHYQHADITCSMQLRMEVGKSDEFGFGVRAGINDESSSSGSTEDERTTSKTTDRTVHKTAELTMRADSRGALAIEGGTSLTPTGDTPLERLDDLQRQLVASGGDVNRLVFDAPDTRPEMSLQTPSDKVVVDSPTVAFLRPDFNFALLRLRANTATDFVVNNALTVGTTAQGDLDTYAEHVRQQFEDAGFEWSQVAPPGPRVRFTSIFWDTGKHALTPAHGRYLDILAAILKVSNKTIEIEGFTDRQAGQGINVPLGTRRANAMRDYLSNAGVPSAQLTLADPPSRGETPARLAGDPDELDNREWRRATNYLTPLDEHWVVVGAGPTFDAAAIAPDARTDPASGPENAYLHLYAPESLELSGNALTVDGTTFALSGAAISGGPAAGTAGAHAENLTRAINATTTHRAWRQGSIVQIARSGDSFSIQLFATSSREVRVAESSDFTITQQFRETTRSVESTNEEQNRTIAVGVSIDARFSRQFNMEVTGNSSISARLVSVPAPPEFLEEIRAYQNGLTQ